MTTSNIAGRHKRAPAGAPAGGRLPVTAHAVLGQLAQGPACGYDVKARLERSAAHFWHASYSQIYAELRRLASLGLAAEEEVVQERRPTKRVYTITDAGRSALARWLEESWGLAQVRDESLLKLMLADPLPTARVVEELGRLRAAHERRRAEFERELASLPEDAGAYLRYALRKGVRAQAAFAEWCQEVIDDLRAREG